MMGEEPHGLRQDAYMHELALAIADLRAVHAEVLATKAAVDRLLDHAPQATALENIAFMLEGRAAKLERDQERATVFGTPATLSDAIATLQGSLGELSAQIAVLQPNAAAALDFNRLQAQMAERQSAQMQIASLMAQRTFQSSTLADRQTILAGLATKEEIRTARQVATDQRNTLRWCTWYENQIRTGAALADPTSCFAATVGLGLMPGLRAEPAIDVSRMDPFALRSASAFASSPMPLPQQIVGDVRATWDAPATMSGTLGDATGHASGTTATSPDGFNPAQPFDELDLGGFTFDLSAMQNFASGDGSGTAPFDLEAFFAQSPLDVSGSLGVPHSGGTPDSQFAGGESATESPCPQLPQAPRPAQSPQWEEVADDP